MTLADRSDFAVLAALDEYGPMSQADLGRHLGLDRNDVNRIVTRLTVDSAVHRAQDTSHRRRNVVTITAHGQQELDRIERAAAQLQDQLLTALDDHERSQLHALLATVLDSHAATHARKGH